MIKNFLNVFDFFQSYRVALIKPSTGKRSFKLNKSIGDILYSHGRSGFPIGCDGSLAVYKDNLNSRLPCLYEDMDSTSWTLVIKKEPGSTRNNINVYTGFTPSAGEKKFTDGKSCVLVSGQIF
jgi:hypothetical protein